MQGFGKRARSWQRPSDDCRRGCAMKSLRGPVDPELEALIENGRIIQRVPDVVRARALARARAAIATGRRSPPHPNFRGTGVAYGLPWPRAWRWPSERPARSPRFMVDWPRKRRRQRLRPRARPCRRMTPRPLSRHYRSSRRTDLIAKPQRAARPANAQESYAAELALLQRAHAPTRLETFRAR